MLSALEGVRGMFLETEWTPLPGTISPLHPHVLSKSTLPGVAGFPAGP